MVVTIDLPISEQMLKDILITCVEGGSNYWLVGCRTHSRDAEGNYLKLIEPRSEEGVTLPTIDLKTIEAGIAKLFTPGVLPLRHDLRHELLKGAEADIDAFDADTLLQLGVFGELIYG
jgi:hypothetical protein